MGLKRPLWEFSPEPHPSGLPLPTFQSMCSINTCYFYGRTEPVNEQTLNNGHVSHPADSVLTLIHVSEVDIRTF